MARFTSDSRYNLMPVLSQNAVAGPGRRTELTSAMCKRVRCLVAVNGDFFASGVPVGGLVSNAEVLRTPASSREQATVAPDGSLALGPLRLAVSVNFRYKVAESVAGIQLPVYRYEPRSLAVTGINVARPADRIVLYTPKYGPRTETSRGGVEIALRTTSAGVPFQTDADTAFEPVSASTAGNTAIPRNGAVLSGHGAGARALSAWWRDVRSETAVPDFVLRIASDPGAEQSISGNPVLLRKGKRVFPNSAFARQKAPRTLLAWSQSRVVYLVTFDGRQSKWATGVTLAEAADFVRSLGATEALNLDGGGSTTFTQFGKVINRPSDRLVRRGTRRVVVPGPRRGDKVIRNVERPVAVALAIVRAPEQAPSDPVPVAPKHSRFVPYAQHEPQRQCASCSARVAFSLR